MMNRKIKELIANYRVEFLPRKEGDTVHFDLRILSDGCICCLAQTVPDLKATVEAIKTAWKVSKVVFHSDRCAQGLKAVTPEVEPDCDLDIGRIPGSLEGDQCGTYPVIKGIGMSWVFDEKE